MATYFLFGKYSSEATKGISAERTEKANKLMQKYGGEIKSIYALLGEKDLVIIASFSGVEQVVKATIAVSKLTGIRFTTAEAIAVKEFDKLISEV
jgi:uncharacterized protein with GYD domain